LSFFSIQVVIEDSGSMTDEALCELMRRHLKIDAAPFLASTSRPKRTKPFGGTASKPGQKGGRSHSYDAPISLEEFVTKMLPLLDLEKDAEIAQVNLSPLCPSTAVTMAERKWTLAVSLPMLYMLAE
jgi:hypothetical protein